MGDNNNEYEIEKLRWRKLEGNEDKKRKEEKNGKKGVRSDN